MRRPRSSRHGMRVRPPNHRVSRVHRPILGVGSRAHQQEPSKARRSRRHRALILRGRNTLRRASLGERTAATILGRYFNSRILLSHSKDQGATPCRSTAVSEYLNRGRSSVRRASRWHREGCRCDSGRLHEIRDYVFACWHRPRVRTSVFQTEDTGANPVARSN